MVWSMSRMPPEEKVARGSDRDRADQAEAEEEEVARKEARRDL